MAFRMADLAKEQWRAACRLRMPVFINGRVPIQSGPFIASR